MPKTNKYYPLILYPDSIIKFCYHNKLESSQTHKPTPVKQLSSTKKPAKKKFIPLTLMAVFLGSLFNVWSIYTLGIQQGNWLIVGAIGLITLGIWAVWGQVKSSKVQTVVAKLPTPKTLPITPQKSLELRQQKLISLLEGKVLEPNGISNATHGVSEEQFYRQLKRFFPLIQQGISFKIPDFKYPYSADFILRHPTGVSIDIEVDEPYVGNTKKAHHAIDQGKDHIRNQFFVEHNWIVVRFSEEQVVRYPRSCCQIIAQILAQVCGDMGALSNLKNTPSLPKMPMWSIKQARKLAKQNYRQSYLK